MPRSIAKLVTVVAAVAAAAGGARAGTVLADHVGLAELWTPFVVVLLAGVALLAVGYAYFRLFVRDAIEDPMPEDASVRAYSTLWRR